jgi:inner membrane protease ATP23
MASNSSEAPLNRANDPAVTGYDPNAKWSNYWNILTGKMTREGQEEFREAAYIRNEARDCARCEEWRDYCFKYSPMVIFMQKNIRELNGDLNAENVKCRRCPARRTEDGTVVRQGGGFSPDHGILICANEMRDKKHLEDTLSHEMVHAWDHLRWKVDWADLRHAACTEVVFTQSRERKRVPLTR